MFPLGQKHLTCPPLTSTWFTCCPPRRLLAAVIGISLLQLVAATGRLPSHHIYQPGKLADSCAPADFHASYWTADGAPGAQPGVALPGTAYAQRVLYQHQHPASCSGLKYLAYSPCYHGIGSTIHIMGQMLSHAMRLNRILMIEENPEHPFTTASTARPAPPSTTATLSPCPTARGRMWRRPRASTPMASTRRSK